MEALAVHVLGVDGDAEALAEQLAASGHTVSGPEAVGIEGLGRAITGISAF